MEFMEASAPGPYLKWPPPVAYIKSQSKRYFADSNFMQEMKI